MLNNDSSIKALYLVFLSNLLSTLIMCCGPFSVSAEIKLPVKKLEGRDLNLFVLLGF